MKKALLFLGLIGHFIGLGQKPKLILPIGHIDRIYSTCFSPDGKQIVTGSSDYTVKIWDTYSGKLLAELVHSREINSVCYSPDGKFIMTSSRDETLKFWDAKTGDFMKEFDCSALLHNLNKANFSSDGKRILTSSQHDVLVLDASTGEQILRIDTKHWLNNTAISKDGQKILSESYESPPAVWDANSGDLLFEIGKTDSIERASSFSPDGSTIITTIAYKGYKIWNAMDGKLIKSVSVPKGLLKMTFFSPNERWLLTIEGYNAIMRDAESGRLIKVVGVGDMTFADFNSDGKLMLTYSGNEAKVWNISTGRLGNVLKGHSDQTDIGMISPNGKFLLSYSGGNAQIWNTDDGNLLETLKGDFGGLKAVTPKLLDEKDFSSIKNFKTHLQNAADLKLELQEKAEETSRNFRFRFSSNMKYLLMTDHDDKSFIANVWSTSSGKLLKSIKGVVSLDISPDSKQMVYVTKTNFMTILDMASGSIISQKKLTLPGDVKYSADGKFVILETYEQTDIYNVKDAAIKLRIPGESSGFRKSQSSPDGKQILKVYMGDSAKIWDINSGKAVYKFTEPVSLCQYSPTGKYILTCNWEGEGISKIIETSSGNIISTIAINVLLLEGEYSTAVFSPDEKYIYTNADKHQLKKWDLQTGELLYSFFVLDTNDYFNLTPRGYYQCSPTAAKLLHYVTKDLQVITFEQLDVKYNRPDKVLEAMGCTDTALINSYRKAYYKRIKKLGIDTASFRGGYSVPESDFENRNAIEPEMQNENLVLHIKGLDSTYQLDRFNLWVNEIPVYGQRGLSIKKRNKNTLDTTLTVQLSEGENRIETSILNKNGTESYRKPLFVNYTNEKAQKEKLHFIGIGIDKFADTTYNLQYSVKDIRDLSKKLKEKFGDGVSIDTLFNENVTIANVKALKKKLLKTSINDKVIISYSGHGLLSKDYDYYLSTYSVNFDKPEQYGLPYDELENLLDSIPARKKLMLIDACHSGEVDKEEQFAMNQTADSMGLSKPKGGKTINSKSNQQLGLKNSFELMQSLFVNVGKSTGATIISAAAGNQYALEKGDLKNGVFTYCIIEAMNLNSTMTVSQLKSTVGKRVVEITNRLQKPTSRNETINSDWSVW